LSYQWGRGTKNQAELGTKKRGRTVRFVKPETEPTQREETRQKRGGGKGWGRKLPSGKEGGKNGAELALFFL